MSLFQRVALLPWPVPEVALLPWLFASPLVMGALLGGSLLSVLVSAYLIPKPSPAAAP